MCCCSTRIVQIGGGGNNPFTFSITSGDTPYNGGAGVDLGPLVVTNGDIVHFWSGNTINFQVIPGSVNVGAEVRIDTVTPGNALVANGVLGLYVPSGGGPSVNIYNADGTLTDPVRTMTVGASILEFNALQPGGETGFHQDSNQIYHRATNPNTFVTAASIVTASSATLDATNPPLDRGVWGSGVSSTWLTSGDL